MISPAACLYSMCPRFPYRPHFFAVDSTIDFIDAKPCSNWLPTILSQSMNRPTAFVMKLFLPDIVHVTSVLLPCGLKVNSAALVPLNGLRNSSLNRTSSFGRLSVITRSEEHTSELQSRFGLSP